MATKILTLGVFDCLHQGHLNLFRKLSKLGKLQIGIVRDSAVKVKKGDTRPIMNENFRIDLIRSLRFTDWAFFVNDFEFPKEIIEQFDIIAVGEDQLEFKGIDLIPSEKKIILPRTEGISTSDIVNKLKES